LSHKNNNDNTRPERAIQLGVGVGEMRWFGWLGVRYLVGDNTNKGGKLQDSVIPTKILDYVSSTYPDNYIIGWELEDKGRQQVTLNNNLELEFDKDSKYLRID
jgi:hypothetical protein